MFSFRFWFAPVRGAWKSALLPKAYRGAALALVAALGAGGASLQAQGIATIRVAAGYSHSLSLRTDGSIGAHGENRAYELGDGTTTPRNTAFLIPAPNGKTWAQVAAGDFRSTALTTDGSMYSWGSNGAGQQGDGTRQDYRTPQLVASPAGKSWVSVKAGFGHTLALCNDGTLYTWGDNYYGQLGNSTTTLTLNRQVVAAPGGQRWTAVAAGYNFSLALCSNGLLYTWGNNDQGQLGDGSTTQRTFPVPVMPPAGQTWTQIAAGFWNSAALCSDGSLYIWGNNYAGQIGDGTTTQQRVPVRISPPAGHTWQQVSLGYQYSMAVCSNGSLYAWGDNYYGQHGDGTNTRRLTPSRVVPPAGQTWTQVACGTYHTLALASDGQVYSTGYNYSGELGDGTNKNHNCFVRDCNGPLASAPELVSPKSFATAAPNPFTDQVQLSVEARQAMPAELVLHNALGQALVRKSLVLHPGKNEMTLADLPPLAQGMYFLSFTSALGQQTLRLAHQ